ncbi:MAG: TldD/PmbA family protein [Candidatus Hermodarchaeota archaeon]
MDPKDLTEYALEYAQRLGASYAESRLISGERTGFFVQNGNILSGTRFNVRGIGIRVLVDGGLGFCSIDRIEKSLAEKAISAAVKMAKNSKRKVPIDFGEPIINEAKWQVEVKKPIEDVSTEEMMKFLTDLDNITETIELPAPIVSRVYIFGSSTQDYYLVTSEGTKISAKTSIIQPRVNMTAKGQGRTEQRFLDFTRCTGWEGTESLIEEFTDQVKRLAKTATAEKTVKGVVDLIVAPEVAGIIAHENCGHPSEGDRILGREGAQAGESFWRDLKLGESRVGTDAVTICDDPTIPGSAGFYLYDDEGVKARKRVLIKEGIINEPLLNREFGQRFGLGTNGSSRAEDFNREPIIRMANTYFDVGDYNFEELVEDVKKGIYMVSFMEWNIDDRRFQSKYVGSECYLIEKGQMTETLVKRPIMELTTVGLFSATDAVSKNLRFDSSATCGKSDPMQGVPVFCGGPELRLRDIKLGGLD